MSKDQDKLKKGDDVLSHNISIAPGFEFPPLQFYELVEKEMAAHKITGLTASRVDYAEGGILSAKRTYLRFIRERLAFDACAGMLGTEYFFSCRTVYSPARVRFWHLVIVYFVLNLIYGLLVLPLGWKYAAIAFVGLIIALIEIFRNAVAANLADLDTFLLKIPGFGPIYEVWFRRDTYFRQDTRLVYLETVPKIIQGVIDEITASQGVKLLREYERTPIFGDLYKPRSRGGT